MKGEEVLFSSDTEEWETPEWLMKFLREEFGQFTLDPCATADNAKCPNFYSREDDGLTKDWGRNRVFMNPPYGDQISAWMKKAAESAEEGALVVALIPARTDTKWWNESVDGKASDLYFVPGRISFVGGQYTATFPSVIVVYQPGLAFHGGKGEAWRQRQST